MHPLDSGRTGEIATRMRVRAALGVFSGRETPAAIAYLRGCTYDDGPTNTRLIFTRDSGHHSSGWMKNPDYERCLHLSMSPRAGVLWTPGGADPDRVTWRAWCAAFFGRDLRLVWAESPKSAQGKASGVWHWRAFCDATWSPILPRGEVYSTELTELGWRSASQVLAEDGVAIESSIDPS